MKKIFAVIILICALSLQSLAADFLIVPGERIGWFTLGANFTEMKKVIGEPESVTKESDGSLTVSYKTKYNVVMVIDKDNVVDIETIDTRYYVSEGIKIGSSEDEVIKAFGPDYEVKNYEGNEHDINYWLDGIGFSIKDKKVWVIGVFDPGF